MHFQIKIIFLYREKVGSFNNMEPATSWIDDYFVA